MTKKITTEESPPVNAEPATEAEEGPPASAGGDEEAATETFPVAFMGRHEDSHYTLTASVFNVNSDAVPTPFFGQNIVEFGWDEAVRIQEEYATDDVAPHEFGDCTIRVNSLRKLPSGDWAMDLRVPTHSRRSPMQPFDKEVLNDAGEVTGTRMEFAAKSESWITVLLTQVTPRPDHRLSAAYFQRDSETAHALGVNKHSAAVAEGKKKATKKKRGKSTRISPAKAKAMLAQRSS